MSRRVLEIENIYKVYRVSREVQVEALKDVTLKVKEGEILVIMGPSGSGKSTLLNIMSTLDKPTRGKVIIDGRDVTHLPEKELYDLRLTKIGFVFQFFNLITTLTALENVMLPMILLGNIDGGEAEEKATELLKIVGLGDRLHARPTQMSGGQQQRVAIARALANDPSIVLMDEPTGSVDVVSEAVILKLVKTINKYMGTTFIIVTHNPEVAVIAHRIVYMRGGRLFETQEIPRINIDEALDEREVMKLQLTFLEKEVKRIKRLKSRGSIPPEEYRERMLRLREKLRRIITLLGGEK